MLFFYRRVVFWLEAQLFLFFIQLIYVVWICKIANLHLWERRDAPGADQRQAWKHIVIGGVGPPADQSYFRLPLFINRARSSRRGGGVCACAGWRRARPAPAGPDFNPFQLFRRFCRLCVPHRARGRVSQCYNVTRIPRRGALHTCERRR